MQVLVLTIIMCPHTVHLFESDPLHHQLQLVDKVADYVLYGVHYAYVKPLAGTSCDDFNYEKYKANLKQIYQYQICHITCVDLANPCVADFSR